MTIAWDVDDVLNSMMQEWFLRYAREQKVGTLDYSGLKSNPPHEILGITLQQYLASLDSFRGSSFLNLKPTKELILWFDQHGHKFRHIALTLVPHRFAPISARWVITHFGKWIRSFNYVPSFRTGDNIPSYDADKGDFLAWFRNAQILIDDNEGNIAKAKSLGMSTCLFPRPWNEKRDQDISECLEKLTDLANSLNT